MDGLQLSRTCRAIIITMKSYLQMTLLLTMDSGHVLNKRSQAITSTIFNSVSKTELKL